MTTLSADQLAQLKELVRRMSAGEAERLLDGAGIFRIAEIFQASEGDAKERVLGRLHVENWSRIWTWMHAELLREDVQTLVSVILRQHMEQRAVPASVIQRAQRLMGRRLLRAVRDEGRRVHARAYRQLGPVAWAEAEDLAVLLSCGPEIADFIDALPADRAASSLLDPTLKLAQQIKNVAPTALPLLAALVMRHCETPEDALIIARQLAVSDRLENTNYNGLFDTLIDLYCQRDRAHARHNDLQPLDWARYHLSRRSQLAETLRRHVSEGRLEALLARYATSAPDFTSVCETVRRLSARLARRHDDSQPGYLSGAEVHAVLFASQGEDVAENLGVEAERARALRGLDQALQDIREEVTRAFGFSAPFDPGDSDRKRWWLATQVVAVRHNRRLARNFEAMVAAAIHRLGLKDCALAPLLPLTETLLSPLDMAVAPRHLDILWDEAMVRAELADAQIAFADAREQRDVARMRAEVDRVRDALPGVAAALLAEGAESGLDAVLLRDLERIAPLLARLAQLEDVFAAGRAPLIALDADMRSAIGDLHSEWVAEDTALGPLLLVYAITRVTDTRDVFQLLASTLREDRTRAIEAGPYRMVGDAMLNAVEALVRGLPASPPPQVDAMTLGEPAQLLSGIVRAMDEDLAADGESQWAARAEQLVTLAAEAYPKICLWARDSLSRALPMDSDADGQPTPQIGRVPDLTAVAQASQYAQFLREMRQIDRDCRFAEARREALIAMDGHIKRFARAVAAMDDENHPHAQAWLQAVLRILDAFQGHATADNLARLHEAA